TASDIEKNKLFKIYSHYACKYRRKCADNRDKPAQDQGSTAIFMIKLFGHDHVFALEQETVLPLEQHGACTPAKPIPDKVPSHTRDYHTDTQCGDIHVNITGCTK